LRQAGGAIEADTYAQFIHYGQLNTNLSPLLQGIIAQDISKS
jgi:hypothetical protein